ncbi:MAG TPA: ribonuclease E/G, partial [Geothermobacteraceae bacterium]|nr:ribonuclease E/G [Geothermobacteraceae bacterium]
SEVARQLRLRDLGGLVVIDFIDMRDRKHIREVEKRLKEALKPDKARVTVGRISQFGLLEMSRQRIKAALAEGSYLSCPNCQGSGRVRSIEAQAVAFLRKLHAAVARGQLEKIEGEVPIAVSHYLLNNKREELVDLERRYQTSISILGRKSFVADQTELTLTKREKDGRKTHDATEPVTAATALADHRDEAQLSGNGEAAAEQPAKKSRNRRRGRKAAKSEQAVETSTINESAAESVPEPVPEVTPSEFSTELGTEPQPTAETTEETAEKRPARRRRGRRSKKPAAIEATGSEVLETEAEPTGSIEAAPAAPEQKAPAVDSDAPAEAKPVRNRRSRRTKKPADSAGTAAETASDTPDRVPEPTAPLVEVQVANPPSGTAVATAETTEAPRKRRPRRTSKPAAVAAETAGAAAQPDKVSIPDSPPAQNEGTQKPVSKTEADSPAADKPRRARRTRNPAASKTADEQAESKAEKVPEPAAAEPEAAEVKAKKPAARRRKPATKKPAPAAEPTSDAPAEEKPKPKRRSRKPTTKAGEETLQPNEAQD